MNKKWYLFLIVMLIGALTLVACGGNETNEPAAPEATEAPMEEPTEAPMEEPTEAPMADTTITIWHGWDGAYYTAIEEVFNEYTANTGVKIELVRQDNLSDAMAVAVPAGEGPDILAWAQDQIGRNALTGNIVPITEWVDEAYIRENFEHAAANSMIW